MSYFDPETKNWDVKNVTTTKTNLTPGFPAASEKFVWFDTKDVQQQINKGQQSFSYKRMTNKS